MRRLMLPLLMVVLASLVVSAAAAQALWAASVVGMTPEQVLASVPGSEPIPVDRQEPDVFGTQWSVVARTTLVDGLEAVATFGFDDGALRVVKVEGADDVVGLAADARCADLLGYLTDRFGAPGARERQSSLGLSLTQATWLEGTVQVVAFCFGGVDTTSYFVGLRQLSPRELSALGDP